MNKRLDEIALLKADKAYIKLGDHVSNTDLHVSSCITESDIDGIVTEIVKTTPSISYATQIYVDNSFYTKSYIDKTFYTKDEIDSKASDFVTQNTIYSVLGVTESDDSTIYETINNNILNQVYTRDETETLIDKKINNSVLTESDISNIISTYDVNDFQTTTIVAEDTTCTSEYSTYVVNALTKDITITLPGTDMKLGHTIKFICVVPSNNSFKVSVVPNTAWTMSNVNGSQYDSFVLNSGVSEFIFVNNKVGDSMWICTGNYNTTKSVIKA